MQRAAHDDPALIASWRTVRRIHRAARSPSPAETIPESAAFVEVPLRLLPAPLVSEDAGRIPSVLGALPLALPPFPPVGRREG